MVILGDSDILLTICGLEMLGYGNFYLRFLNLKYLGNFYHIVTI